MVSRLRLRLYKATGLLMLAVCAFLGVEALLPSSLKMGLFDRQPAGVNGLIIVAVMVMIWRIEPVCRWLYRPRRTAVREE